MKSKSVNKEQPAFTIEGSTISDCIDKQQRLQLFPPAASCTQEKANQIYIPLFLNKIILDCQLDKGSCIVGLKLSKQVALVVAWRSFLTY